jgi:hypothetical protein
MERFMTELQPLSLAIGRYRARFITETPLVLPAYPGSVWRGAFGHALRNTLCVTRLPTCEHCELKRSCSYAYIFETPPPPNTKTIPATVHQGYAPVVVIKLPNGVSHE